MVQFVWMWGVFMYGSYIMNLDAKFRFYLPASFRKKMNTNIIVLTLLNKDNLVISDANDWRPEYLVSCIPNELSELEIKNLIKFVKFNSCFVSLDREHRIQIPSNFISNLSFDRQIVVCGEGNYLSVISKSLYDSYMTELGGQVCSMIDEKKLSLVDKSRL